MAFSTRHVAGIFGVSRETARAWSREFARHLSDDATPDKGSHRHFSDGDMEVFALVAAYRREKRSYVDIHKALDNGERGEVPHDYPLAYVPKIEQLALFEQRVADLETELRNTQDTLREAHGQIALLKDQLQDAQNQVQRLNRELGRWEAQSQDTDTD
jgi:DNA-binding transcriptional MerR regulator